MRKIKDMYACGTTILHEAGDCNITLYPTVAELKEKATCWEGCGIVQVKIAIVQWVEKENVEKMVVSGTPKE